MKGKKKNPTEHQIQSAFFEFLKWKSVEDLRLNYIFAIPNGGYRFYSTGKKLKKEGVKPGVPDVFVPIANNKYGGLFIEFKRKGGYLSDKQKQYLNFLKTQKYKTAIVYSLDEAIAVLYEYLNLK